MFIQVWGELLNYSQYKYLTHSIIWGMSLAQVRDQDKKWTLLGPRPSHPKICFNGIVIIWIKITEGTVDVEVHFDSLLCLLKAGNKSLMWKLHPLHLEVERQPYHQREGIWSRKACINKSCYFSNLLPQVQTLFRFFPNWGTQTFLCLVTSWQIYCFFV